MHLPGTFEHVTWRGLGPHENYPDRQEAATYGTWSRRCTEMPVPYIVPQETGNRGGAHWVAVSPEHGHGLLAWTDDEMAIKALPYTAHDLQPRAAHLGACAGSDNGVVPGLQGGRARLLDLWSETA